MASAITHAFIAIPLGKTVFAQEMTWRFWALSIFCSVIPDIDTLGFFRSTFYGSLWGHRGLTHSLFFAFLLGLAIVWLGFKDDSPFSMPRWKLWLFFFPLACTHGLLDAMTGGGYGVAFFSPFDPTRYSLPWTPLKISPIGLRTFFSPWGKEVLVNEIGWVWIPSLLAWSGARLFRFMNSRFLARMVKEVKE
jgi:inner membrane protein